VKGAWFGGSRSIIFLHWALLSSASGQVEVFSFPEEDRGKSISPLYKVLIDHLPFRESGI